MHKELCYTKMINICVVCVYNAPCILPYMQDLAVVPLLSPDSDADSSDSDIHSTDSEPRIVCECTSDSVECTCNKLPSAGT